MSGFFEIKKSVQKVKTCSDCRLLENCNSPRMKPYGSFKKGIMTIGEAPGYFEDSVGKPWQGITGNLLNRTFEKFGINLFEDCINLNAVSCRPIDSNGRNKTPNKQQIDICRRFVMKAVENYKPKMIFLFGGIAVESLFGLRWKKELGTITKWRGFVIPDQELKAWICPLFHPSYIERSDSGVEETVWKNDLKNALNYLDKEVPVVKEPVIHFTDDLSFFNNIKNGITAFDLETTGLKPHAIGHRIICCAVAVSADECYVFRIPQSRKERQPFIDYLENDNIKKIAHNIRFELEWCKVKLGVDVKGWEQDTMVMAHILDNRTGITSLAFQTYVNFGVIDYKDETQPYLEADKKNANSINRIMEFMEVPGGSAKLLGRCADDAIFEYRLYEKQKIDLLPF